MKFLRVERNKFKTKENVISKKSMFEYVEYGTCIILLVKQCLAFVKSMRKKR